jgi:hypothetical protein
LQVGVPLTSAINHADEKSRRDCNTFRIHYPRDRPRSPVIKRQVEKAVTGASVTREAASRRLRRPGKEGGTAGIEGISSRPVRKVVLLER